MYAVEFETSIDDGIIHIPEKYQNLQQNKNAKVIIMVDEKPTLEEKQQQLIFGQFLKTNRKVEKMTIISRDSLHDR